MTASLLLLIRFSRLATLSNSDAQLLQIQWDTTAQGCLSTPAVGVDVLYYYKNENRRQRENNALVN